jgi:integrase
MASVQQKGDSFYCQFYYLGRRYTVTFGAVSHDEADARAGSVDLLLLRIKQKLINVPAGVSITDFVLADGKVTPVEAVAAQNAEPASFSAFRQKYLDTHRNGAMEDNSLATVEMHLRHFERTLGEKFPLQQLQLADLQRHVNERSRKKYRGRPLSPITLKKEVASFRAAWNWATLNGLVKGSFPSKGLVYPKADELPPFMTWPEIERKRTLGRLSAGEEADLWDCLYLRKEEIEQLLTYAREKSTAPWLYPMLATAAYTGARRSELLRMELADVDFEAGTILVREKKRSRKQRTTRHVSLSPALATVLKKWVEKHPGGKFLFCQTGVVARSKKRSRTTGHRGEKTRESTLKGRTATVRSRGESAVASVTKDEAHDHLKRTLAGSKWEVLKGYHVLRHSFISCLAAAGVDQRIIDDFVGHCSEEQRRRYRHLLPDVKQKAITGVFG